jgi:RHS repeat-associated protein
MLDGLGLDEIYARVSAAGVASYLPDGLGNTRMLTDADGIPVASYSYSPYGSTSKSELEDSPFQFTGRENDGPSNLRFYRSRYYSAELARFISQDRIALSGGINTYAYVNGDPVSMVDPEGEFGIVGALVSGGIDLGIQLLQNGGNFRCVSWLQVGGAAALGAIGGGGILGSLKHTRTTKNWFQLSHKWEQVTDRIHGANPGLKNIELHHWLIERNSLIGSRIGNWLKNHPWNWVPVFKTQHIALHQMNPVTRTVVASPGWARLGAPRGRCSCHWCCHGCVAR